MPNKLNKLFNITFLIIFLSLNLFINFFHTGKELHENDYCPACHFQNSTLATSPITILYLPQLTLLEILEIFESFHYDQLHLIIPLSRSPPLA